MIVYKGLHKKMLFIFKIYVYGQIHTFIFYISFAPGGCRPNADMKYDNWCLIVNACCIDDSKTYFFRGLKWAKIQYFLFFLIKDGGGYIAD